MITILAEVCAYFALCDETVRLQINIIITHSFVSVKGCNDGTGGPPDANTFFTDANAGSLLQSFLVFTYPQPWEWDVTYKMQMQYDTNEQVTILEQTDRM